MSDYIDPDQFIISRKRKQYKFAKFANSPLCFELEQWQKTTVDVIELGAGTGLFSVELASRHPDLQYVAVDVKADRLQKGAYEAEARGLSNIRFIRARADQLGDVVPANSLHQLWLTFPDPFPKPRSAGRRMTHSTYLYTYTKLLKNTGSLFLKHDDSDFFCWSLEQLVSTGWRIAELSFDLHDSNLSDDYKIMTTYEKRWIGEGCSTQFIRANIS
jgi:tRNA (guanine-N7-)-methyltransferase